MKKELKFCAKKDNCPDFNYYDCQSDNNPLRCLVSMEQISRFKEFGYMRDREQQMREISNGRGDSLALEAANQIKHLKDALKELVSIVEIHSQATGNNFAWAEIDEAKKALNSD